MAKKTKRELIFVPAVRLLQLQEERVTLPQRMRVDTGALDARLDFYMEQFLSFERAAIRCALQREKSRLHIASPAARFMR